MSSVRVHGDDVQYLQRQNLSSWIEVKKMIKGDISNVVTFTCSGTVLRCYPSMYCISMIHIDESTSHLLDFSLLSAFV